MRQLPDARCRGPAGPPRYGADRYRKVRERQNSRLLFTISKQNYRIGYLIASSVDAAFSAQRKARALAPEPSRFPAPAIHRSANFMTRLSSRSWARWL